MINETANFTIRDFRIKTRSIANYSMSTHHFHDDYEIYYMNAGSRNYFINDITQKVSEGNIVLIKPYDLHKTIDTGVSHSRILISFNSSFLPFDDVHEIVDTCFQSSSVYNFDHNAQIHIENLLTEMIIEANMQDPFFLTRLQSQLTNLLIVIARYIHVHKKVDENKPPTNQKIYDILQYLKVNFNKDLNLEDLSKKFYISPYYMTRVFKKSTGFTIFEYIHSLRIIEARHLLKTSNKKVIDIAQAVGFNNVSNFGKVFKSLTGITPLHYRKRSK